MTKSKSISVEEFDKVFDEGKESILPYMDMNSIVRGLDAPKRANVDFPIWMIKALDKEAARLGVARQALIKMWIAEKLKDCA